MLGLLKVQVGPFVTTGETVHASCTAELKPFVDPTVIVAVAETPACPDVFDNAPLATVKLAFEEAPVAYLATKASITPPKLACRGLTVGNGEEAVLPAT